MADPLIQLPQQCVIICSRLIPRVRRVSSRILCLQRSRTFGAMRRFGSWLVLKLKPKNFRSAGRATALLASFTLSLSRRVSKRVPFVITRCPAHWLRT